MGCLIMRVYLETRACEQRNLENEQIKNWLRCSGHIVENEPNQAEICVLTTCGVDRKSVECSKIMVNEMLNFFTPEKIIVGGCLPEIEKNFFEKLGITHLFSPQKFETINEYIDCANGIECVDIPSLLECEENRLFNERNIKSYDVAKHGHKIVVSKGCLNNCSYCAIKYATGKLKSRTIEDIINQINSLKLQADSSVMLMAGDTGAYGRDINTNFCQLLTEILKLEMHLQLCIHDLNLNWIIKDLDMYMHVLKEDRSKSISILNIPVQSGSNKILKLMRRGYTFDEIISTVNLLKNIRPDILLGTHIMIGFPTETDEDFSKTIEMLKLTKFDFITCFPYSEHAIAESHNIEPKVEQQKIDERLKIIEDVFGEKIKIIR